MSVKDNRIKVTFILKTVWNKLSVLLLVPFLMLFVLLNVMNIPDIVRTNDSSIYFIDYRMLCMIPIGLGILLITSMWCYIVENGRELFYIRRSVIFNESIVLTVLYVLAVTIEYLTVYRYIAGFRGDMFLHYIILIFCVSGGILCLIYRIRNMTISIMFFVFLYLLELLGDHLGIYSIFSWHYDNISFLTEILCMCLIGIFCWRDYYRQLKLYAFF